MKAKSKLLEAVVATKPPVQQQTTVKEWEKMNESDTEEDGIDIVEVMDEYERKHETGTAEIEAGHTM